MENVPVRQDLWNEGQTNQSSTFGHPRLACKGPGSLGTFQKRKGQRVCGQPFPGTNGSVERFFVVKMSSWLLGGRGGVWPHGNYSFRVGSYLKVHLVTLTYHACPSLHPESIQQMETLRNRVVPCLSCSKGQKQN